MSRRIVAQSHWGFVVTSTGFAFSITHAERLVQIERGVVVSFGPGADRPMSDITVWDDDYFVDWLRARGLDPYDDEVHDDCPDLYGLYIVQTRSSEWQWAKLALVTQKYKPGLMTDEEWENRRDA